MRENVTFYSGQKSDKSTEALRRSGSIFIANEHTCLNPTQFSSPLDACASVTCVELHQVQQRHADSKAKRDIHFGRKKLLLMTLMDEMQTAAAAELYMLYAWLSR